MLDNDFYFIREFLVGLSKDSVMLDKDNKQRAFDCLRALETIQDEFDLLNKRVFKLVKKLEKKKS